MVKYYQVNQAYWPPHEFVHEYLCAPNTSGLDHHQILKRLEAYDVVFNYCSKRGCIIGASQIIALGAHKDSGSEISRTAVYRVYGTTHLSLSAMSAKQAAAQQHYHEFIEVHTKRLSALGTYGPNFFPRQQIYCREIPAAEVRKRLAATALKAVVPWPV